MDRDPRENAVDPEDRTTPTTGQSPYGESGAQRSRAAEERDEAKPRDTRGAPGAATTKTPLPPD